MISSDLRKAMVEKNHPHLSIEAQCALLDLHRSTYYYQPLGISAADLEIMRIMDEMSLEDPTRGTRRYAAEISAMGYCLGRDHARTLMRIMGLYAIYPRPRTTVIDKQARKYPYLLRGVTIERKNQVWSIDISYIPMRHGFMYLVAIMDVYSRYIVGWDISNSMDAEWVVKALKRAIQTHGVPEIINSDQGSQFTGNDYIEFVKSLEKTRISMDGKGRAIDNVWIERFFRTIKYDRIYLTPPENGAELYQDCDEFINYYNNKRSHSSIGRIAPVRVYKGAA